MKVLAGIYRRDAGTIRVRGEEVDIPTPAAAQHLGISIIHQELNLMPHLTVAQNIFIGREPRRWGFLLDDEALNAQARELFERLAPAARPARSGRRSDGGQAADGRDRQGAVVQRRSADHGRADRAR